MNISKLLSLLSTPLQKAIKDINVTKFADFSFKKRINDTPGSSLPNISRLDIQLNTFDIIFLYFGIKKRKNPTIKFEPYKNGSMNRYIKHQILRLTKYRDENSSSKYGRLSQCLMKRSNVGRVMAINHVFPQGHRKWSLSFIISCNRKLSRLINEGTSTLDYQRIYIPKGESDYRPLGVPSPEGRLYLHMYSCFLTFGLSPHLRHQHGFLPTKGTLSAWQEIVTEKLYKKPFIYEGDFKSFFDLVETGRITADLINDYNVPESVALFLERINRSPIKLPRELKLDESAALEHIKNIRGVETTMHSDGFDFSENLTMIDAIHSGDMNALEFEKAFEFQSLPEQHPLDPKNAYVGHLGVAQGSPTSPILANLIMNHGIKKMKSEGHSIVCYADDSVTFSDKPITEKIPVYTGIIINRNKSGYVKKENIGLKPLKFLGLEFNEKLLKASTRKGSILELPEELKTIISLKDHTDQLEFENIQDLEQGILDKSQQTKEHISGNSLISISSGEKIFKSKLMGYVQSRLYSGDINLINVKQDFSMTFVQSSGMNSKLNKYGELSIFESSSYANYSLANVFRFNSKRWYSKVI